MKRYLAAGLVASVLILLAGAVRVPSGAASESVARQDGTPVATDSCDDATPVAGMHMGTPMGGMDHGGMSMGTPMAGMAMELDQLYIDMMIPHHASIVAMAQVSFDRLQDERLVEIARTIVDNQTAEIEELRGYRERFYGSAEPMPMDDQMMGMMTEMMPGMGPMDQMAMQMDPAAQVAAICGAEDADLAFIDLTIPHHEMAIAASEAALDRATHEEIRAFAGRVIEDQRREIDELRAIREELAGSASPEPVAG